MSKNWSLLTVIVLILLTMSLVTLGFSYAKASSTTAIGDLVQLTPMGTLDNPIYVYAKPGDNVTLTFTLSTSVDLTNVTGKMEAFGLSWSVYIGDVAAFSSKEFNVVIPILNSTKEGVYPAIFSLSMEQMPQILSYLIIIVDETAPLVNIYSPEDGSILRGAVNVSLLGFDSYIDRVELYIDNTLIETWDYSGNFTYLLNTTSYTASTT